MGYHTQLPGLFVAQSGARGRGVYTSEKISIGAHIEVCPVIILSGKDTDAIHNTFLHDYYFLWDEETKQSALALGYGCLYNHSINPNAEFELLHMSNEILIKAIKDIEPGQEITINYQTDPSDDYPLWFDPKE